MFRFSDRAALPAVLLALAGCAASQTTDAAPVSTTPPAPDGSAAEAPADPSSLFTEAQADRGRVVFRETCSECHYTSEVRGEQFMWDWGGRTVGDLLENLVRTMPDDGPGSLPAQDYVDVVAYILRLNGFPSGTSELTADGPGLAAPIRAPARP